MVFLVLSTLLTVGEAGSDFHGDRKPIFFILEQQPSEIPHYKLSLQWSAGACQKISTKCRTSGLRNFWTIHGLWPISRQSQVCNKSLLFDEATLQPLMPQLTEYWPSLKYPDVRFWKHEWDTHGQCAMADPATTGLLNYFNTTLILYFNHNITQYLQNNGILPTDNKTYTVRELQEALYDDFKGAPETKCIRRKDSSVPFLSEVVLCFGHNFVPTNCTRPSPSCGQDVLYYLTANMVTTPPATRPTLPTATSATGTATQSCTCECSTPRALSTAPRMSAIFWLIGCTYYSPSVFY